MDVLTIMTLMYISCYRFFFQQRKILNESIYVYYIVFWFQRRDLNS
uniref:Uncharacterized protein n=1 Tax=Podoviridae sp. ctXdu7 TaxID=2827618 RepID=A0A8S5RRW8_9CAUD|nr:MAG TPA: hypothetical protein [Podoviridae sp. ctXdu7]